MTQHNCPNCGDTLAAHFTAAKMVTCVSCGTTVFLDGPQIQGAGDSGVMHEGPELFGLGQSVKISQTVFDVLGHARFDYGAGWWDEYWVLDQAGKGAWISVDEGDVILQRPLPPDQAPKLKQALRVGSSFQALGKEYRVLERDQATCIAFKGTFPEHLHLGATYSYMNCQNTQGEVLSGEFCEGLSDWHAGWWIDPFDVQIVLGT